MSFTSIEYGRFFWHSPACRKLGAAIPTEGQHPNQQNENTIASAAVWGSVIPTSAQWEFQSSTCFPSKEQWPITSVLERPQPSSG